MRAVSPAVLPDDGMRQRLPSPHDCACVQQKEPQSLGALLGQLGPVLRLIDIRSASGRRIATSSALRFVSFARAPHCAPSAGAAGVLRPSRFFIDAARDSLGGGGEHLGRCNARALRWLARSLQS